jgi:hypothetical protein
VLDSFVVDEDHAGSGIFILRRLKTRIQKILEHQSEHIAQRMISTLDRCISNYEEYCEWKMAMAFYITLHERASCIPYGAVDQHIADEWVRMQMMRIRGKDHDYPEGLVDTFRRAEKYLLLGSGLSFKSVRDQVEFVFKKGPLHRHPLMSSLSNVSDERLADEIRQTRRDERFQGSYPHNLAYRSGRHDDEAELYWQRTRNANVNLQSKSRPISGARAESSKATMYSPEDPASSTSTQGTVEKTGMDQSTYQSDRSEQSESVSESDEESIGTRLRAEKVPKEIRQGSGKIVELGPGVFSPTMPRFTSIITRQPPNSNHGHRCYTVIYQDGRTEEQHYHTASSDAAESPTKKRRPGTAARDNQPSESRSYVKAVILNRRDISKLPAFGHTDAHGSRGPRTKMRDTGLGDM